MTTPDKNTQSAVDKDEAERMARRARRRAKRLLSEADGWEEHSATEGRVPAPDPAGPARKKDVLQAAARAEEVENTQLPAEHKPQAVGSIEPQKQGETVSFDPREEEIAQIQRELVQRRRRRFILLWLRLTFFVVLPTFLIGNYYYKYATPFYSTETSFKLQPATGGDSAIAAAAAMSVIVDSIAVQEFLTSREAMRILDQEFQIIDHFADPNIDPIQRLETGFTENDAYALFKDRVLVGFDMTEGLIRLEVIAAEPDISFAVANRLIEMAELRVDEMSDRNELTALGNAEEILAEADVNLGEAYDRVLALQEQLGIFSADIELGLVQGQINSLTSALEDRRLSLAALMDNARPNQAQVRVLNAEIARLEQAITDQRANIVSAVPDQDSLARVSVELERAQQDLDTRKLMLGAAVESLEIARRAAAQQAIFLSRAVNPVRPIVASYPRTFEYTVLAFIIFFAAYMIVSLTISILREQMSYGQ